MIPIPRYLLYMAFAVLAIAVNTATQGVTAFATIGVLGPTAEIRIFSFEMWYFFALGAGTVTGFVFKFLADKFVVFGEKIETAASKRTARQIEVYFLFAILTTAIFWGTETLFKLLWSELYLVGGVIGLAIGYSLKYVLDRKFVFSDAEGRTVSEPAHGDANQESESG
jgi:putative flippase GtrA